MNSPLPNTEAFNVLIWIKLPFLREQEISQWFNWLSDVIKEKKLVSANVTIVPVSSDDSIDSNTINFQIDALWTSIKKVSTRHKTLTIFKGDTFSKANCLRGDKSDPKQCFNISRDPNYCGEKNLLLFLDEDGVGYPCFGCWSFHKQDPSLCNEYRNNQRPFKVAAISEDYCGKCPQCINWSLSDKVPCLGGQTTVRSSHIETVGCPHFEVSTQELIYHGRRFLQEILWRDNFKHGKKIILDPQIGIEKYWSDNERIGNCQFQLDTAVNDSMPLFYQCMQAPQGSIEEIAGSGLLPWAFVPAVSSLFFDQFETDRIMLMSIIFVKRPKEEDADFHYRSLYKDAEVNSGFKLLWRWPEEKTTSIGAKWSDHALNFSAEFLDRKMGRNKRIPYVLSFSPANEARLRTRRLSESRIIRMDKIKEYLSPLYGIAQKICNYSNECQSIINGDKTIILGNIASMLLATGDPVVERFYEAFRLYNDDFIEFFGCLFGESGEQTVISDNKIKPWLELNEKGRESVRKLANYFIWLLSLFPDAEQRLGSVEGFHMTFPPDSQKAPGGIVVYSAMTMRSSTSALIQLMLDSLLSPIEQVYLNQEKEDAEKNKNEAQLIPKWAHGQRTSLFGIESCIAEASRDLDNNSSSAYKKLSWATGFIEQARENINLLQETGSYGRSLNHEEPRWKIEIARFPLKVLPVDQNRTELFVPFSQGMRTAFLRLFAVDNEEKDERYFNAFGKFFISRLLQQHQPHDYRASGQYLPNELKKIAANRGINFDRLIHSLQDFSIDGDELWQQELLQLVSIKFDDAALKLLKAAYIPHKGWRHPAYKDRGSNIIGYAIRMVVEEIFLNYIKHGAPPKELARPGMIILADIDSRVDFHVKLTFLNRTDPYDVDEANESEQPAGSVGTGLLLCNYILSCFGGYAEQNTCDVKRHRDILGNESWKHSYCIELSIPARMLDEGDADF